MPFKIYADFEFVLKRVPLIKIKIIALLTLNSIKSILLAVLLIKSCVLMVDLANQLFSTKNKMQSIALLQQFLLSMIIVDRL